MKSVSYQRLLSDISIVYNYEECVVSEASIRFKYRLQL